MLSLQTHNFLYASSGSWRVGFDVYILKYCFISKNEYVFGEGEHHICVYANRISCADVWMLSDHGV